MSVPTEYCNRANTRNFELDVASVSERKKSKPTLRSIARDLDTSICTVSRVLSGKAEQNRIPKATCQRVLDYANRVGYRPNLAARGLRLNRMQDIGLILPDFANPFFVHIAKCVANEVQTRHYSVLISETSDQTGHEIEAIAHMLNRRVEGLIVWPVGLESKHLQRLAGGSTPIVLVDRCFPDIKLPQVAVNNTAATELATQHLLDFGHRRIACFQGLAHTPTNEDRLRGYRNALVNAGIDVDHSLIIGAGFTQESGYQAAQQLLKITPRATAILSLSNQITLGTLRALAEHRIDIPEQISLVSFDDIECVEHFSVPLTVISQPLEEIGQIATRLLFESIDDGIKKNVKCEFVSAQLISRKSVKRL